MHRLLLLTPTSLMTPGVPDLPHESRLTIGPKTIKDIIEQFPPARGSRSDPQLIWHFGDSEVKVRSLEYSIDAKGEIGLTHFCFADGLAGQPQLSTKLMISTDEFNVYNVHLLPFTIAFHLREFNVCSDLD
jgi:cell cycle checkpoint control protein RAD9A